MDGGFGDDADGGRANAVPGASMRGLNELGGRLRITKQDDYGHMPVPNRRGGMPVQVHREDRG